ncbi:MAG: PEP-CTERM sorting domain-containing protein, partial [Pseudomonadota bacterium]
SGMTLLESTTIVANQSDSFFGFLSDMELITEVRLTSSLSVGRNGVEGVDNIRFGIASRQQVAEPASLALLGLGLAGMGIARRRKA